MVFIFDLNIKYALTFPFKSSSVSVNQSSGSIYNCSLQCIGLTFSLVALDVAAASSE